MVVVPPEGGLEFSTGLTKKIVLLFMSQLTNNSGLPYKIVDDASSSSQEALLRKAASRGLKEKRQRLQSVPLTLPASYFLFLPCLSSLPLAPPRALMTEGTWTCALLSGCFFRARLVAFWVSADYKTQHLGTWVVILRVLLKGHALPDSLIQTTNVIPKLNFVNRLLISKFINVHQNRCVWTVSTWSLFLSNTCTPSTLCKEAFVY